MLSCQDELGSHTQNKNVHRWQIGKGQDKTKQTQKAQGRCTVQEQGGMEPRKVWTGGGQRGRKSKRDPKKEMSVHMCVRPQDGSSIRKTADNRPPKPEAGDP